MTGVSLLAAFVVGCLLGMLFLVAVGCLVLTVVDWDEDPQWLYKSRVSETSDEDPRK